MTRRITLSQGKVALIDDADFLAVSQHKWSALNTRADRARKPNFYATSSISGRKQYLHRFIMGAVKGQMIDHINHDGLDCHRANMRFCTQHQNNQNARPRSTSAAPYKGVVPVGLHWMANITHYGRNIYLGTYATPKLAAAAYDEASRNLFGAFAHVNFPETHASQEQLLAHRIPRRAPSRYPAQVWARIDAELKAWIEQCANKNDVTLSTQVRLLLEQAYHTSTCELL